MSIRTAPAPSAPRAPSAEAAFLSAFAAREAARSPSAFNQATECGDAPAFALDGEVIWFASRADMVTALWIRGRMAFDIAQAIEADADHAVLAHDDLAALGWRMEQVRNHGQLALTNALAMRAEAANGRAAAHQAQVSGFAASALLGVVVALCGAIGIVAAGIASL